MEQKNGIEQSLWAAVQTCEQLATVPALAQPAVNLKRCKTPPGAVPLSLKGNHGRN
jgi:hypothetical protein